MYMQGFLQSTDLGVKLLGYKTRHLQLDVVKLFSKAVASIVLKKQCLRKRSFYSKNINPIIFIANIVPSLPFTVYDMFKKKVVKAIHISVIIPLFSTQGPFLKQLIFPNTTY